MIFNCQLNKTKTKTGAALVVSGGGRKKSALHVQWGDQMNIMSSETVHPTFFSSGSPESCPGSSPPTDPRCSSFPGGWGQGAAPQFGIVENVTETVLSSSDSR